MSNPHGSFIWYELITTDTKASGRFYSDVVGWSVGAFGGQYPDYGIFSAGESAVAGMMALPDQAAEGGMRPGWFGYIGVDDVETTIAAITDAGGRVHMPASELPGVGRMAMVADPQGALFYVMRGASDQSSTAFDAGPDAIGRCGWNELATSDLAAGLGFYTGQFGWTKGGSMSMGDRGDYQFIDHAGEPIGAAMTRAPDTAPPMWRFYFRVRDIDAAFRRTTEAGGTIMHGPAAVPGDVHVVIAADPQGAVFALVGRRG